MSRSAAISAAALAFGLALPLLTGTEAWAVCGADLKSAGRQVAARHQGELTVTRLGAASESLVAGGKAVEIPVRITNRTDGAYLAVEPILGLAHFVNGHDLELGDVRAAWKTDGAWHDLPLQPGCTRGIVNEDDAFPTFPLGKGESKEITVRLSVPSSAQQGLDWFDWSFGPQAEDNQGGTVHGRIKVTRPRTKPAPTASAAVVPAADTTTPAATPTAAAPTSAAPTTPVPAEQQALASTGPSKATAFLFWSAGAMLLLGGGVLYAVKRISRH